MTAQYQDLDGVRITDAQGVNVWLIFHGQRHRIVSPGAYEALFSETEKIYLNDALEDIESGADIGDDARLVSFDGDGSIYLATVNDGNPILFCIDSYDTFLDFSFDLEKVIKIPSIFHDVVQRGEPLISAPDRAARS